MDNHRQKNLDLAGLLVPFYNCKYEGELDYLFLKDLKKTLQIFKLVSKKKKKKK